ncbi:MAG: hypothetical protein AB1332_03905 [Pseudomonadota bacterium]
MPTAEAENEKQDAEKGHRALFQLAPSRHMSAMGCEDQSLGVMDLRASHPWLALTGR